MIGRWLRRLRYVFTMSAAERGERVEICVALLRAHWQVHRTSFRALMSDFDAGECGGASPPALEEAKVRTVLRVRFLVARTLPWLPVRVMCLAQSIAAARLLRRRGCDVRVYLGLTAPAEAFTAHAWLRCGPIVVTGEREAASFTPVASFLGRATARG